MASPLVIVVQVASARATLTAMHLAMHPAAVGAAVGAAPLSTSEPAEPPLVAALAVIAPAAFQPLAQADRQLHVLQRAVGDARRVLGILEAP